MERVLYCRKIFLRHKIFTFFGFSYLINDNLLFKFEHDTTVTEKKYSYNIEYDIPEYQYSFGIDFISLKNLNLGIAFERGSTLSLRFNYKNDPKISRKRYKYRSPNTESTVDKYTELRKNLESNGIGVNKIIKIHLLLG